MADNEQRKNLHTVYLSDGVWESMQTYARYFTAITGIRNNRGQPMGAGTFVNIACKAYIKEHKKVLELAEQFFSATDHDEIDSIQRGMSIFAEEDE